MKIIDRLLKKWALNFITKRIGNMKGSWKTTGLGIAILVGAIASAAVALLDGDPTTTIDMAGILAALAGVGLIKARDNSVTSKKAGAE